MRLNPQQIQTIKQVGHDVLGEGIRVVLFGSRVSDDGSGGDIDLLFESPQPIQRPAVAISQIYAALVMKLGDQKIDILLKDPSSPMAPVMSRAIETGVVL